MGSLAGRGALTVDHEAGVGVDVERRVVLGREPHTHLGRRHRVQDGSPVVVTEDSLAGPAVVLGVAVSAPLAHSTAMSVAVPGERELRVGSDGVQDRRLVSADLRETSDRDAERKSRNETEDRDPHQRGSPPGSAHQKATCATGHRLLTCSSASSASRHQCSPHRYRPHESAKSVLRAQASPQRFN